MGTTSFPDAARAVPARAVGWSVGTVPASRVSPTHPDNERGNMTTPVTTHLNRAKPFGSATEAIDFGKAMVVGYPNWVVRCDKPGAWFIRLAQPGGIALWYKDTTVRLGDRVIYTGAFLLGLITGPKETEAYRAAEAAVGTVIAVSDDLLAVRWDEASCWTRASRCSEVSRQYVEVT